MAEPEAVAVIDPYDLGDTDLYPKEEVRPVDKSSSLEPPETIPAPGATPSRVRDPKTGRFLPQADQAPEPEPAPASTHPDWLVQQAKDFGFEDDEIAGMDTSALTRQVKRQSRLITKFREEQSAARELQSREVTAPTSPVPDVPPATAPADDFDLKEEDIAPEIYRVLRSQHDRLKALEALVPTIKKVDAYQEQRRAESLEQWADRLITQHGDKTKIGEGPMRSLEANSPAVIFRQTVAAYARRLAGEKAGPREWIPRIPEALAKLNMAGAPESPPEPEKPKNGKTKNGFAPEEWRAAALQQPTHRSGAQELKGDALAVANLERKLREQGQGTGQEDSEIMDTLL